AVDVPRRGRPGKSFWDSLPKRRPWVVAHRGDSAHAPENTLEAARLGHLGGADLWELDVQLARDGVPIVVHEGTLVRTTDAARTLTGDERACDGFRVADFTSAEARGLDAGSWFLDPAGPYRSAAWFGTLDRLTSQDRERFGSGVVRMPTLVEALELTAALD